jgi:hypothetical protein
VRTRGSRCRTCANAAADCVWLYSTASSMPLAVMTASGYLAPLVCQHCPCCRPSSSENTSPQLHPSSSVLITLPVSFYLSLSGSFALSPLTPAAVARVVGCSVDVCARNMCLLQYLAQSEAFDRNARVWRTAPEVLTAKRAFAPQGCGCTDMQLRTRTPSPAPFFRIHLCARISYTCAPAYAVAHL